jgi:hypothetical protein
MLERSQTFPLVAALAKVRRIRVLVNAATPKI